MATGHLLGIDVGDVLDVTHCFPDPIDTSDGDTYVDDMRRLLRAVNVDTYPAGYYMSTSNYDFYTPEFVKRQFECQVANPDSVCIVFDPTKSRKSAVSIRAFRLTVDFMQLYSTGKLSANSFSKAHIDSMGIFEDIPVQVRNSHLVHAFLYELHESRQLDCTADRLSLNVQDMTERLQSLVASDPPGALCDLILKQQAYSKRQGVDKSDSGSQEPSRLETFLASIVADAHCTEAAALAGLNFVKENLIRALVCGSEGGEEGETPEGEAAKL